MRVLNVNDVGFLNPAGALYMVYQIEKEALALAKPCRRGHLDAAHVAMSSPIDTSCGRRTSGAPTSPNSRYYGARHRDRARAPTARRCAICSGASSRSREQYTTMQQYVVVEGDRLDNLANAHLGDPLLYWMICDANARDRSRRADRASRAACCAITCLAGGRTTGAGAAAVASGLYLTLLVGPVVRAAGRSRWSMR